MSHRIANAWSAPMEVADDRTLLILLTDGCANVPLWTEDPWANALRAASQIPCRVLVIDTESAINATGGARQLAASIYADCIRLGDFGKGFDFVSLLPRAGDSTGM